MSEEETGDKPHDPTPKRVEDARKKGDIARSTDLGAAASYVGLLFVLVALGGGILSSAVSVMARALKTSDTLSEQVFRGAGSSALGPMVINLLWVISPVFLVPLVLTVVAITGQRALTFAPSKLAPKGSRISPLKNAANKFGRNGLFEFSKSTAKLMIFASLLGSLLWRDAELFMILPAFEPGSILGYLDQVVRQFLVLVCITALGIGAIDYFWQRMDLTRRLRMSHQELKDEVKTSEGDPHIKGQRRQFGHSIVNSKMLAAVADADVLVVNPTHFAVALKWDRSGVAAPVCVAKGVDHLAARLREVASEAAVPIHRDPATARALFATLDIGDEVRPEHFEPVAAAIRFADLMRKKAKSFG